MKTLGDMETVLRSRGVLKAVTGREKSEEKQVSWLTCDSRNVKEGTLFICKGAAFRKEYLQQAVRQGCIAYVGEQIVETEPEVTGLIVNDIRKAMAILSAAFFGYRPGRPLLTGITGTKGKTTTAWYLKAMLDTWEREQEHPETGLISTVENYDGKHREDAVMTTPEAPTIHEFLANAVDSGIRYATMEVSSQALKYKRVKELQFQVGIFLNISEDHISPQEHEDFEDYFSSKLSMFRQTQTACVNLDADYSDRILKAARKAERVITFGRHPQADLRCSQICMDGGGISFQVTCDRFTERFSLGMKGSFNIENAMAAIAAAYVYGVPVSCMKKALQQTKVPGRMENFVSRNGKICSIVDFAHNRLSFEKLFDAVYQEYGAYKRIITVFGCPGGKALNRRRELGLIAGLFSDYVYITSDDPGMECPEKIGEEVRSYVEMTGCPCRLIEERQEAVGQAVRMAAGNLEKTLILVLGRGSEKYQNIGGKALRYPTDAFLVEQAMEEYDTYTFCKVSGAGQ
ncbi:MAG: UDP-N-acetylmuramyl-tripeptide synthetase [Lachnospiraceae bacterium]|nr:UDP-N-acetylmuramyl-tripeptide synthetase [Lachnospiraceae bacterium]